MSLKIRLQLLVLGHQSEGDALTYSLSGDDASLFLITSTGTVRFVSTPDFENPQASAGGNPLTVSVSDGALTGSKDFSDCDQ